jgi:hypothetical protein
LITVGGLSGFGTFLSEPSQLTITRHQQPQPATIAYQQQPKAGSIALGD